MIQKLFSFEGRIRRTEYGITLIVLAVLFAFLNAVTKSDFELKGFVLIFYIPLQWILFAQGAKRSHDIENSGWWQLLPGYHLWILISAGTVGDNIYGADPKQPQVVSTSVNSTPVQPVTSASNGYQGGYGGGHNSNGAPASFGPAKNSDSGYRSGDLYK